MSDDSCIPGMSYASLSERGNVRETNEDCKLIKPWPDGRAVLLVLADGMGGQAGGGVASSLVIECFEGLLAEPVPQSQFDRYEKLLGCFYAADDVIKRRASTDFNLLNMGATVIAAIITTFECLYLYAGDCRFYHFRDGSPLLITADHSVVRMLVDAGRLAPDAASSHPMKSVVTSSIGASPLSRLHVDPKWAETAVEQPAFRQLQSGDLLLFCTDGLTSEVGVEELKEIIHDCDGSVDAMVRACVAAALQRGGSDNVTVAMFAVTESRGAQFCSEDVEGSIQTNVSIASGTRPASDGAAQSGDTSASLGFALGPEFGDSTV